MFKALLVIVGVFVGVAQASAPSFGSPEPTELRRGPFSRTPIDDIKEQVQAEKTAEQLAAEERLRQLEATRAKIGARVVVLRPRGTTIDHTSDTLRRNIRARIARPEAMFYPDIDLYQFGRKEPDPTLRPLDQRARVPDEVIAEIEATVAQVSAIPWNGLESHEWGRWAARMKTLADSVWFVDRLELRDALFRLYGQIGRAAENANNSLPPFFEQVSGTNVNYYHYLAATMAERDSSLMSLETHQETYAAVDSYLQLIRSGGIQALQIGFDLDGVFDPAKFTNEYVVYFDGKPDQVTSDKGLYKVWPGQIDIYLERPGDGFGLATKINTVKVSAEKIERPVINARTRMGLEFIDQLLRNPDQCLPDIEGDILNYLAIYQTLHPSSEVYIAIPEGGSAHRILLWKWQAKTGNLVRIQDNTGGFPIRFAVLLGTGVNFNGATFAGVGDSSRPSPFAPPQTLEDANQLDPTKLLRPRVASIPISYELRGHYNRLMVGIGMDLAIAAQDAFHEMPRTRTREHRVAANGDVLTDRILLDNRGTAQEQLYAPEVLFQRGQFLTVAGVLGKDAAVGFGPRIGARTGWYNAPNALDANIHLGYNTNLTAQRKKDKPDSRVHAMFDTTVLAGMILPFGDTVMLINSERVDPSSTSGPRVWGRQQRSTVPRTTREGNVCRDRDQCKMRTFADPMLNVGFSFRAGLTF